MNNEVEMWSIENPPGQKKLPQWQRSYGIAKDGEIWLPAALAGDEMKVVLCAGFDCISLLRYLGHVFVPSTWLEREFPETANFCQNFRSSILANPPKVPA